MSMKFIMLINVEMPTIVDILTFISMINTTFESLEARNVFIFQHFSFIFKDIIKCFSSLYKSWHLGYKTCFHAQLISA